MSERSALIEWLRGEIVGRLARYLSLRWQALRTGEFLDATAMRRGPLA